MSRAHVGASLGHYRIVGHLGSGAMSEVYRALDPALNVEVAVKVISDALVQNLDMMERFRREAQAAAQLAHPNVARVFYFDFASEKPFYAMELIRGSSLATVIEQRQRFTLAQYLEMFAQAARGLRAASDRGIIHRDIKPGNLMVGTDGLLKIVDFGLAKLTEDNTLTSTGTMMGTPYYVSPEGIRGESVDLRADVYSLGVTFYHLLTGSPPYEADTAYGVMSQHIGAPVPDALRANPRLPGALAGLLARMMAKEARRRPQDYDVILGEIAAIGQDLGARREDELAWCEQDRTQAFVQEGRCTLCRAPVARRRQHQVVSVWISGWRGPEARRRTVDYVSRAIDRDAEAVSGMLAHLPFKLAHRIAFEKARRMQRTFHELGADVEMRPVEGASAQAQEERLVFPVAPPPVGAGASGRREGVRPRGGGPSDAPPPLPDRQWALSILVAVLAALVVVLAIQVWRLSGPRATGGVPGGGAATRAGGEGAGVRGGGGGEDPPAGPRWSPEVRGAVGDGVLAAISPALDQAAEQVDAALSWSHERAVPIVIDASLPLDGSAGRRAFEEQPPAGPVRLPLPGAGEDPGALLGMARYVYARGAVRAIAGAGRVPPWLETGLALHFEGGPPVEETSGGGTAPVDDGIPLRFWGPAVSTRDPGGAARARSVAEFLVESSGGEPRLLKLLQALGEGSSLDAALAASFGLDADEAERLWRTWESRRGSEGGRGSPLPRAAPLRATRPPPG
ncbi:serine/threonine protein kinase [Myxococcota bacterium]|nr:serine/threonine protein kinase [Myxococcota bacterium]